MKQYKTKNGIILTQEEVEKLWLWEMIFKNNYKLAVCGKIVTPIHLGGASLSNREIQAVLDLPGDKNKKNSSAEVTAGRGENEK